MQFEGPELENILRRQVVPVHVQDSRFHDRGTIGKQEALQLVRSGLYVGVGNRKRIRFLRPLNRSNQGQRAFSDKGARDTFISRLRKKG